jgi:hypothetical protein
MKSSEYGTEYWSDRNGWMIIAVSVVIGIIFDDNSPDDTEYTYIAPTPRPGTGIILIPSMPCYAGLQSLDREIGDG